MFKRLEQKWKVGPLQMMLIIICFALGGTATSYVAKKIIDLFPIRQDWLWAVIYILLVTLIWPLAVVVVSIFFGQLKFFTGYVRRLGVKLGIIRSSESDVKSQKSRVKSQKFGPSMTHDFQLQTIDFRLSTPDSRLPTHLAIFASGAGTNTQKIIDYFRNSSLAKISLIVCNKKGAGVLRIAEEEKIPSLLIEKEKFFKGNAYLDELKEKKIDFIVLAGFLWKIPETLLKAYPRRIINIHPALLPKYGGQGMYGNKVHEAVLAAKEKESGITIHFVDEHYDHGDIILQVKCSVLDGDTPEILQSNKARYEK